MLRILFLSITILVFITNSVYSAEKWTGVTKPVKTDMKYFLHTGFKFDAVLKTAIFSFNTITPVIAETEYDTVFLDKVVIPKGTKIIGQCSIVKTINRVNVIFNTIVFPDGQEINFNGLALHTDGSGGIPGKVTKQRAKMPAQILLRATAETLADDNLASDLIQGLSQETSREIQEKVDYSISIEKDILIQVYVVERIEY